MAYFCHLASILTNTDNILKIDFCYQVSTLAKHDNILKIIAYYLASILTNIDDKAKNLTIYCQVYTYGSGNSLLIIYPELKFFFAKL